MMTSIGHYGCKWSMDFRFKRRKDVLRDECRVEESGREWTRVEEWRGDLFFGIVHCVHYRPLMSTLPALHFMLTISEQCYDFRNEFVDAFRYFCY